MENLIIKNNTSRVIRKAIAVIFFINGILWILGHIGEWKIFHWVFGISFIVLSIAYFTDMFGTETTYLHSGPDCIKIKWINKLKPVILSHSEIEIITLTRMKIIFEVRNKKPIKFSLDFLERDQKETIYKFLIEYASERNLKLVRDF